MGTDVYSNLCNVESAKASRGRQPSSAATSAPLSIEWPIMISDRRSRSPSQSSSIHLLYLLRCRRSPEVKLAPCTGTAFILDANALSPFLINFHRTPAGIVAGAPPVVAGPEEEEEEEEEEEGHLKTYVPLDSVGMAVCITPLSSSDDIEGTSDSGRVSFTTQGPADAGL